MNSLHRTAIDRDVGEYISKDFFVLPQAYHIDFAAAFAFLDACDMEPFDLTKNASISAAS